MQREQGDILINSLLISDLHFTDNPRDAYRWKLFDWLLDAIIKHDIKYLFVLGDLTDAKDHHSARLVNMIVTHFLNLYRRTQLSQTYILKGNHDGTDPACPYFAFLGQYPSIKYIATPFAFDLNGMELLMLPHTRDPLTDWADVQMHTAELLFMHATVAGALSENGMALDGIPASLLATARRAAMWSGDIHVPQKVGRVEYVGAPYPVRFGDKFTPRAVMLDRKGKATSLPVPAIQRRTVDLDAATAKKTAFAGLSSGDQVKVRLHLKPSQFMDWQEIKRNLMKECVKKGIDLCGLELVREQDQLGVPVPSRYVAPNASGNEDRWADHCKAHKLDKETRRVGREIMDAI